MTAAALTAPAGSAPGAVPGDAGTPGAIEFRDVAITYGGKVPYTAVRGVSLQVQPGEFVAVVGPSGCGKSTLIKLVAGLLGASEGTSRVLGSLRPTPGKVGIAFQNASLLPWRSVLQNVLLPLEVAPQHKRAYRQNPAPYIERARALLRSVGLEGAEGKNAWELSGGMQQRVNLCRALIHEPEILLLDEPFGALDAFTREELWMALQDVWTQRRPTVMLITHDLREATLLADTVYIMGGRPGGIVMRRAVDLPRPRTLEGTFDAPFVEHVRVLRDAIGHQHGGKTLRFSPVAGPEGGA
ncbi:ABC transporter ATP-binding protein [Deinococcus petrolearius]|uniref:ABC transporter ATP-binding protein n=1 Tax=Deinococcus petrolearius TaxID=1751295 RepID=A0ABW1DIE4_9DEIO